MLIETLEALREESNGEELSPLRLIVGLGERRQDLGQGPGFQPEGRSNTSDANVLLEQYKM